MLWPLNDISVDTLFIGDTGAWPNVKPESREDMK